MRAEPGSRAHEIARRALERPLRDREEFVELECGDDADLRRAVAALIAARAHAPEQLADTRAVADVEVGARSVAPDVEIESLKICSRCGSRYGARMLVCPRDGEVLVEDPEQLVGSVLDGRYRIDAVLGAGGFGVVYRAHHLNLRDEVAVKVLPRRVSSDPDWVRRFLREGRAARAIRHPNAVAVHDLQISSDGVTYMVQEYVPGRTLRAELASRGPFEPAETVELLEPIAGALDEAHAKGIVHRDLKPDNIMVGSVDGERVVKLLDLGIAKLREILSTTEGPESGITHPGSAIGTPLYMSPEQWGEMPLDGNPEIDGRADVYSFAAMIYEMSSGAPPFRGKTSEELRYAHVCVEPRPLAHVVPRVPEAFSRAVHRAMAKERRGRQATVGELVRELRRAVEASGSGDVAGSAAVTRLLEAPTAAPPAAPGRALDPAPTLEEPAKEAGARWPPGLPRFGRGVAALSALARHHRAATAVAAVAALACVAFLLSTWIGSAPARQPSADALFWYKQGTLALRDGLYLKARNALEQAVAIDDGLPLARARLAEALTEIDQTDRALREIGHARSLAPDASSLAPADGLYLRAINDVVIANYAGAAAAYAELVDVVPAEERAAVLVDLGRAHERNQDAERALESYLEAARLDPNSAAPSVRLGVLYSRGDRFEEADEQFTRAEALHRRLTNVEGVAEVLLHKGAMYVAAGRPADARAALERALEMSGAIGSEAQRVRVLFRMSSVSVVEGRLEHARRLARLAFETAEARDMEYLAAAGLVELGTAYFNDGKYEEAERLFGEAIDRARRNGARITEARASLMRGSLRVQTGRLDDGRADVEHALAFYSKGGYHEEINAGLNLRGRALAESGDDEAALEAFREQLRRAEERGRASDAAAARDEIGHVLAERETFLEALEEYRTSAETYGRHGDEQGRGYALASMASVEWQLGRYDEALGHVAELEAVASLPGGSNDLAVWALRLRSHIALSRRELAEAIRLSANALALGDASDAAFVADAESARGLAEALSGQTRSGLDRCRAAVEAAERTQSQGLLGRAFLARARAALAGGDPALALESSRRAYEILSRGGRPVASFFALAAESRALQAGGDMPLALDRAARAREALAVVARHVDERTFRELTSRPDVARELAELDRVAAGR